MKYGTTYLELSWEPNDGRERIIHRQLYNQEAYDTWHLALYLKEILSYKQLLLDRQITIDRLPRKEKNLSLFLILACQPRVKSILELGSSLFELIDGLELVRHYFRRARSSIRAVDLKSFAYIGIEVSSLLSQASLLLHRGYW